jgi:hypothetical protein
MKQLARRQNWAIPRPIRKSAHRRATDHEAYCGDAECFIVADPIQNKKMPVAYPRYSESDPKEI